MKVALLFAGQYREISEILFKKSLSIFVSDLDYDIYSFVWEEVGKSLNHRNNLPKLNESFSAMDLVKDLFTNFNLVSIQSESFNSFKENLDLKYKNILNAKEYHFGTINSLPQIYSLSECFNLIGEKIFEYDLIFRCRFDSLFIHPLKLYDLRKIYEEKNLYNINFGRAYFPNRIYDIFFGGSTESMIFLANIWQQIPELISNKFNNNLDKRDSCRLLYLAARQSGINVKSFDMRCCDVFRNINGSYYESYLLSMHLINHRIGKRSIKSLYFFLKWVIYRRLNFFKLILTVIKTFFLIPITYLKRILYLF
tara:strand:+ start:550 stop:1479 length:930 start_codon:yes stop_codon:yes gene_type:complete